MAVCGNHLNKNRYLQGYKTAAVIKEKNEYEFSPIEQTNAVQTPVRTRRLRDVEVIAQDVKSAGKLKLDNGNETGICVSSENEELILIPALEADAQELSLLKVDEKGFIKAQRKSEDLKELFTRAVEHDASDMNRTYSVTNGLLEKNGTID